MVRDVVLRTDVAEGCAQSRRFELVLDNYRDPVQWPAERAGLAK